MQNIYLIGFAGVGKSSLGHRLAEDLDMEFLDTDTLIEEKVGKAIPQIFDEHGEGYFRRKEQEVLDEISQKANRKRIISTGGGTPTYYNNLNVMTNSGKVLWIDKDINEIYKVLKSNPRKGLPIHSMEQLDEIYHARSSFYALADEKVDISKLSLEQIKDKISEWLD